VTLTLLLLAALAAAGPACAGASPAAHTQAARPDASACLPTELRAMFRGFQATGASLIGAVVVTDSGARACRLEGAPRSISVLDDSGNPLSVKVHALDVPADAGPVGLIPGVAMPTFGAAPVHGSAWIPLTWTNWCAATQPVVRSLLIVLPAGGSITAPLDTQVPVWAVGPPAPHCIAPGAGSTLSFGRFRAAA